MWCFRLNISKDSLHNDNVFIRFTSLDHMHALYISHNININIRDTTTAFQAFRVVTKNRCHLRHHTFKKSQKYLYSGKNIKKNFLQLRCSNVLLLLKYEVLFCELKIQFNNLAGGKALATDHRDHPPAH